MLGLPPSEVTAGEVEAPNVTLSFWEPERENLPFVANEAGVAALDVFTEWKSIYVDYSGKLQRAQIDNAERPAPQ